MKRLLAIVIILFSTLTAQATTFYVSKSGSNSNDCVQAQTVGTAKLTISAGLACLAAADTLIVKAGNYSEGLTYNAIPDGTDDSHHTLIQAADGEVVIISGTESNGFTAAISGAYKTIHGFIFDATNATNGVVIYLWATAPVPAHNIIIEYNELKNVTGGTSACITAGGNGNEVHNVTISHNTIHDCIGGTPTTHGIYAHFRDSIIEYNEIYNIAGSGIQQYTGVALIGLDNNIIRANKIHNVAQDSTDFAGIYAGEADNTLIYNNSLSNAGGHGSCIEISATTNIGIYNNVCYDFVAALGISGFIREAASGTNLSSIARNNIGWNNGPLNTIFGSAWTQDHNMCSSACASSADPKFVNESTRDFHLQAGSYAITNGTDLSGAFPEDGDGLPRTLPWTIGAFIYNTPLSRVFSVLQSSILKSAVIQ